MTSSPPTGERIVGGRYALAEELGRGGMGVVWRATDRVLQREVAIKEISYPVHLSDEERDVLRERTLREARAAARLEDPHVVAIHDVVEEDGRPWLVMEHVRSRSLQRILEQLPAPKVEAVEPAKPSNHLRDLEKSLSRQLGMKVQLKWSNEKKRGKMVISYTLDQFDDLKQRLGVETD